VSLQPLNSDLAALAADCFTRRASDGI